MRNAILHYTAKTTCKQKSFRHQSVLSFSLSPRSWKRPPRRRRLSITISCRLWFDPPNSCCSRSQPPRQSKTWYDAWATDWEDFDRTQILECVTIHSSKSHKQLLLLFLSCHYHNFNFKLFFILFFIGTVRTLGKWAGYYSYSLFSCWC